MCLLESIDDCSNDTESQPIQILTATGTGYNTDDDTKWVFGREKILIDCACY